LLAYIALLPRIIPVVMAVTVFVSLLLLISGDRAPQSTLETESSFEKKSINSSTVFGIIGHHGSVFAAQRKVQKRGTCVNAPNMGEWLEDLGDDMAQIHFLFAWSSDESACKVWVSALPQGRQENVEDWLERIGAKTDFRGSNLLEFIGQCLSCMFESLQTQPCMTFEMGMGYQGLAASRTYEDGQNAMGNVLDTAKQQRGPMLEFHTKDLQAKGPVPTQVLETALEMFKYARSTEDEWKAKVNAYASKERTCPQAN